MARDVDVVVIGLGPGGEALAARLAGAGLAVVGVDERLVGGECPYFACVPTKMMVRAAGALAEARRVDQLAGHAEVAPDWTPVATRIADEATGHWDDRVAVERLEKAGVQFVRGHGRLTAPRTVEVAGEAFTARRGVVLNTGTAPAVPPIDGLAETPYWTNRDIVRLTELPRSLAIIGGGPIGVELAQVMGRFGVEVTLLEVADRLLAGDEPEAGALIADVLAREGVSVSTGVSIGSVAYAAPDGFTLSLGDESVTAERLLVAAGRRVNLSDIGLDTVGLPTDLRAIEVDDHLRAAEGLWAIGDITGKGAFTHMSMYQAEIAARDILGDPGPWADYRAVPRVTFADPEVGSVGLTEAAAREAGLRLRVGSADLSSSARGWIHGPGGDGLLKLVEDADRGVLVGATSVGPCGGEVLAALALAVHAEVPVSTLRTMICAYPTFYRALDSALADLS